MAVNDHFGSERTQEIVVPRARRSRNPRSTRVGELHEQMSNTPGGAVHEYPVTRYRVEPVDKLQRSCASEGKRSRLELRHQRRAASNQACIGDKLVGVRPPTCAPHREQRPDFVSFDEIVYERPHFEDDSRALVTDDVR
jgi:hypothetical protein